MSSDALARRKVSRQQNRATDSRASASTIPQSTPKEISWTKTVNYEEQQEQMLREMFANKGRLWSVLKSDDRETSDSFLVRPPKQSIRRLTFKREPRRPVSSLFSAKARIITSRSLPPDMRHKSPPRKTFPRFRGLPNITSAPCSAGTGRCARPVSMTDASTGCLDSGEPEAAGNRSLSSTERSDRRAALSEHDFSNGDDVEEVAELLPDAPEKPKSEPKPPREKAEELRLMCYPDKKWPPNPAAPKRSSDAFKEFVRSELHQSLTGVSDLRKLTAGGGMPTVDDTERQGDGSNTHRKSDRPLRLLRRIDIQPVNDAPSLERADSDEGENETEKLSAVESPKKNELEEMKKLVDALTLEVMVTNKRHNNLLEEFEDFKEKSEKEVGALQEAVTLLADQLRQRPAVRPTEKLEDEMCLEVQGHICPEQCSDEAADETDVSDTLYGYYESGEDARGAFIDRDFILDKLQALQSLEQVQTAHYSRHDQ